MQPINYNLDVANPFQAALQGYQTGVGIQQVQQAQQDQMLKQQQAQKAMQAQQKEQARVQAIQQKYANFKGAMTPMNAIEFASTMPAPMVTALKDQFAALGGEAGKKELGNMAGILSSLRTNPEVAQNLIQQKIDAATNSGNNEEAASFKSLQDIAKTDPIKAYNALTPLVAALGKEGQDMLASVSGAEKTAAEIDSAVAAAIIAKANATNAAENAKADAQLKAANAAKAKTEAEFAVRQELGKLALNKANIANLNNQIADRSAQRNIDRQRLALETTAKIAEIQAKGMEIPEHAQKLVNESATSATANKLAAEQQLSLATQLEQMGGGYGTATSAADFLRKATGNQSPMTQLRNDYARMRNSAAIKSLPPGVATDKDIELALKGIPPENADARVMASFLRGMAKANDMNAALDNAKTDWLTSNKGQLGRARTGFIAGDFAVKAGESYGDFSSRVSKTIAEKYKTPAQKIEEAGVRSAALIPTKDVPPAAARPVSSIRSQADAILSGGR
jgi:hypothetical protein